MSSQQLSLESTRALCLELQGSSHQQLKDYTFQKDSPNLQNRQPTQKESQVEGQDHSSSIVPILALIFTLTMALAIVLWLFCHSDSNWSNSNIPTPRLLNEMSFKDSISKRLSADEVPRWYDLNKQDDQFVYKPNSDPLPSYVSFKPSPALQKEEKEDALSIIFDHSTQLNYQIVAAITGEKMKLAVKLLDLNRKPNKHKQFIFDYENQYYESKYNLSHYEEKPICVIVPTFHNAQTDRAKINIQSILQQQYSNYHIVIIDDASTDRTADLIQLELDRANFDPSRYHLIRNQKQMKAMYNIRTAAKKYCHPEEIMIIIDGDDELVGRQVFKLFNAAFQREDAWFVYSNFVDIASNNVGYSRPFPPGIMEQNSYRDYLFLTSHLRAFYTKLFLRIREEDLKDMAGNYYQAANDVAICLPILEMSHKRVFYLPELTYGYNSNTGNNNHIVRAEQQGNNNLAIRKRSRYIPLSQLGDI